MTRRVRRSGSKSYLLVVGVVTQILWQNPNRALYSVQNLDAANSVFVSPFQNVTTAPGAYQGQEIVARGFLSDDVDQGEVYAVAITANVRIVVQETVEYELPDATPKHESIIPKFPSNNPRETSLAGREKTRLTDRERSRSV